MTGARYKLEMLQQYGKRVKTKSQEVLGVIPTVVEVTGEKLVARGAFLPPPLPILKPKIMAS